ncbi:hypothetical protein B0O80DRAFT_434854 [Mortierella sp. GBAus27b]|nr:hypothetical protein B0O80DRAFT_434854 [Mortierella sp. GBAus27b]
MVMQGMSNLVCNLVIQKLVAALDHSFYPNLSAFIHVVRVTTPKRQPLIITSISVFGQMQKIVSTARVKASV